MSSALRAPEARFDSPVATRPEAQRPSVCFVGFSNLAVLAPEARKFFENWRAQLKWQRLKPTRTSLT